MIDRPFNAAAPDLGHPARPFARVPGTRHGNALRSFPRHLLVSLDGALQIEEHPLAAQRVSERRLLHDLQDLRVERRQPQHDPLAATQTDAGGCGLIRHIFPGG